MSMTRTRHSLSMLRRVTHRYIPCRLHSNRHYTCMCTSRPYWSTEHARNIPANQHIRHDLKYKRDKHWACSEQEISTEHAHNKRQVLSMLRTRDKHWACSEQETSTEHAQNKRQALSMLRTRDKHWACSEQETSIALTSLTFQLS